MKLTVKKNLKLREKKLRTNNHEKMKVSFVKWLLIVMIVRLWLHGSLSSLPCLW